MKRRPGQTNRLIKMGYDRMVAVTRAVRSARAPLDVHEVALATDLSVQCARCALHKAIAMHAVSLAPVYLDRMPRGRPAHLFKPGLSRLPEESGDVPPVYRLLSSPFAVAAGAIEAPRGGAGRIFSMDVPEDLLEA